ncbi:MAG: BREX system ATP-binding domain-containing protein, partial [Thermoplasmata archaeon]
MPELDFQPEMVGRDEDLKELQDCLDRAAEGRGSTLFISGEAGIGKTRLVDELKLVARSEGFQVLSGNCMYESLMPYMPFMEALRSGDLGHLFAEETPKVEWVYLVTDTGLLIKEVLRGETQLDSDTFASMLKTVSDFVRDSLSMLSGDEKEGALSSLGYEDYRILIERGVNVNLAVVLTGRENEFLVNDMREILLETDRKYGDVLKAWDGEEGKVRGIEKLLKPLITSGKYDGIYYGRENPKARRNLLLENVSLGLMRQAQTRPTLLCIEDLQWADPSTLAMMHYVARNVRKCGLLILGTYRPEDVAVEDGLGHPLSERMQLMSREELHEKMDLQRLPKESMVGVLSSMLGEIDFSDDFGNRFYKETEGNPLFVIELVKLMVDEEIIKTDNRTWKLVKNLEEASIPSKIYDVIVRRLNRVEREERRVLDYASVVGEAFTSTILASALNEKRMQLLERLRGLEQTHRLIHSHDGGYRFDHAKIKEVLYNEIPEELRTEYHSIIADSIEELHKDDLDEVMEDLAFHYYRCENREKALLYLSKAAEKAKKEYSNEEAIRFYTEALELEDDAQKRMEIFECLGGVYFLIGDYKKSIESRESALELTKERRKRAEIKVWIGDAYDSKGESDESMKLCTEALELVKGEECKEEALAFGLIGSIHNQRGEYDRAL